MIRTAFDAGSDVAVYLKHLPHTRFHGRVQDIDDTFFSLYHAGEPEGWLWALRLEDVVACALIMGPPQHPDTHPAAMASPLSRNEPA
jgi:hypothetical protein